MTGQIPVIVCLSYSDLVVGAVARPGCDAQKPGRGSLPCSITNTKPSNSTLYQTKQNHVIPYTAELYLPKPSYAKTNSKKKISQMEDDLL